MTVTFVGSPNYNAGRSQPITKILIHWMAGDLAGTDATFRNVSSQVSAHYGVEDSTIHQYVKESDTAWHAVSANPFSIGIEHSAQPGRNASDATYTTSIQLCAAICKRYGLDPDADIEPHSKYVNTQCPGTLDLNRIKAGVKQLLKGEDMPNEGDVQNVYLELNHRRATPKELQDYTSKSWSDGGGIFYNKVVIDIRNMDRQLVEQKKRIEQLEAASSAGGTTCTPDERQLLDLLKRIK